MLVVKPTDGPGDFINEKLIDVIAGEMLNKEISLRYWIDGVKAKVGTDITEDEYVGYPKIISGNIRHVVRAARGIIFTTEQPNDEFCEALRDAVVRKEAEMVGITPLERYHTRAVGLHTNVKIKSQMKLTVTGGRDKNNIKRSIITDVAWNHGSARFTWVVRHIRYFNESLHRDSPDEAISNRVCSVLYDSGDITSLSHGDILTNYSTAMLKATPYMLPKSSTVRICSDLPLLALAIDGQRYNDKWYTIPVDIYSATVEQIVPEPVKTDEDGIYSTEHCAGCRKLLYDDVYAFTLTGTNLAHPDCHMYCVLCAHSKSALYALADGAYSRVLRVTWPRTTADMIAQYMYPALRPVLVELLESYQEHGIRGDPGYFVTVGKKYVGVRDVDAFRFRSTINHELVKGREIFQIYVS